MSISEKNAIIDRFTRARVYEILQKPIQNRTDADAETLIHLFYSKIKCLGKLERGVLIELMKIIYHKRFYANQEIITAETADSPIRFFIILKGAVCFYDKVKKDNTRKDKSILKKKTVRFQDNLEKRKQPRNWLESLGARESFGDDPILPGIFCSRNVRAVCDTNVDVIVVPQDQFLYQIQFYHEREMEQKRLFVKTHPYFSKWTDEERAGLVNALSRVTYPAGSIIVKQGGDVTGIYFLLRGRGRVSGNPNKHRNQFPEYFDPFYKSHMQTLPQRDVEPTGYPRRTLGYAAMERLALNKRLDLCFVEEGEMFGDLELLLGIHSNIFTVVAFTICEIYFLSAESYQTLVSNHQFTLNVMRMVIETKLLARKESFPGKKLEILPMILYRLRFLREATASQDGEGTKPKKKIPKNKAIHRPDLPPLPSVFRTSKPPQHLPCSLEFTRNDALINKGMRCKASIITEYGLTKLPPNPMVCKTISREVKHAIVSSMRDRIEANRVLVNIYLKKDKKR